MCVVTVVSRARREVNVAVVSSRVMMELNRDAWREEAAEEQRAQEGTLERLGARPPTCCMDTHVS